MKKLFNKKAFALLLCLVLALTAMLTVTVFADTAPADEIKKRVCVLYTGGAIGMGMAISKSAEGIARQPEAEGKIRTTMMLGLVFLETAIIYALLVVILIIFVL